MKNYSLGVDIGGTTVKLGLFTITGELICKWEIPTRKDECGKYILSDITESINYLLNERKIEKSSIAGVGVGVPGPVRSDGTVLKCVNLGWDIFNVEKELEKLVELPVKAANDANIAALGEMWQGGGKGFSNLVMVTLGTGVGGGVIINGKIIDGNNGAAGEIGHMRVSDREEESCGCGKKGCLEQYASATGIVRVAKGILENTTETSALREVGVLTAKDIFDAARNKDKLAMSIVEDFGNKLGSSLALISCVIDPEIFVIGGGVSRAGEVLIEAVKKHYEINAFHASRGTKFELATLGNDAGIYGGAKLVQNI